VADWSLLLAGLDGVTVGEIDNASDRRFDFPLNRIATGQFRIRLDHPFSAQLLEGDSLIKLYQRSSSTSELRMVGEVVSVEEVAGESDAGSLAVTFAEAGFFRLNHRLVGKSATGVSYGTALSPVDRGLIAQQVIEAVNTETDTGVRIGSITASANGYVGPWWYKPVGEAILELSATLDGFDFRFNPVEPTQDSAGLAVSQFTAAGALGQLRPDTVFEFGTGKRNMKSLKRQVSRDGLMTRGYHLPPGFPETSEPVVSSQNLTATAARGLHEGLVTSDLSVADLRAALVAEHVEVRKQARQLITFEPTSYGTEFNVDYEVGDVVTARAVVDGSIRFDASFRIYGVEVSVTDEGLASYSLTLVTSD
jgi:hypothetical protein